MTNSALPSVARLVGSDFESALSIPVVQAVIAAIDETLSKVAESNEPFVEISPSSLFGSVGYGRDSNMVVNMMRPGFAVLSARQTNGVVATGSEFARLLAKAARAVKGGPKADDAEVFFRIDLNMLRAAAEEKPTDTLELQRPLRRARP